jgi:hypothetical protein
MVMSKTYVKPVLVAAREPVLFIPAVLGIGMALTSALGLAASSAAAVGGLAAGAAVGAGVAGGAAIGNAIAKKMGDGYRLMLPSLDAVEYA